VVSARYRLRPKIPEAIVNTAGCEMLHSLLNLGLHVFEFLLGEQDEHTT
jgi:hypothetical protein